MNHSFEVDIAVKYGVNAAVLFESLGYWTKRNEANGTNFFDGHYWTFNSRRALRKFFPYMSERQINTAFQKLIADGLVITGNYNKMACDRTLWYALTDQGQSLLHFDRMQTCDLSNEDNQNVKPIPVSNTIQERDISSLRSDISRVGAHSGEITQIISYLNEKAGTAYRPSSELTRRLVNARFNDGFKVEDFRKVIDNKVAEWNGTDMQKFLRPETLFGNKFEGYLNQKATQASRKGAWVAPDVTDDYMAHLSKDNEFEG